MVVITFMGLAMISMSGTIKAYKASIVSESFPGSFWSCGRPRLEYSVKVWLRVINEIGEYDHVDSIRVPTLSEASNVIDEIDRTLSTTECKVPSVEQPAEGAKQNAEQDYDSSSDSEDSEASE
jgi:hypothetical protein